MEEYQEGNGNRGCRGRSIGEILRNKSSIQDSRQGEGEGDAHKYKYKYKDKDKDKDKDNKMNEVLKESPEMEYSSAEELNKNPYIPKEEHSLTSSLHQYLAMNIRSAPQMHQSPLQPFLLFLQQENKKFCNQVLDQKTVSFHQQYSIIIRQVSLIPSLESRNLVIALMQQYSNLYVLRQETHLKLKVKKMKNKIEEHVTGLKDTLDRYILTVKSNKNNHLEDE